MECIRGFLFHGEFSSPSASLFSNVVNSKLKFNIMDAAFAPSRPPEQAITEPFAPSPPPMDVVVPPLVFIVHFLCGATNVVVVVVVKVSYFLAARWRCGAPSAFRLPRVRVLPSYVPAVASGVWSEVSRRRDHVTRAVSCLPTFSSPTPLSPLPPFPRLFLFPPLISFLN